MHTLSTILIAVQIFLLTSSSSVSTAKLVNVTVDDSQPLISYSPPDYWKGTDCADCAAHPDPKKAYQGTWHDSSHIEGGNASTVPIASLDFTGSAIYAYAIISHSFSNDLDGSVDLVFFLDGEVVGQFQMAPTNEDTYSYNVSVYSNASFPHGDHSFEVHVGRPGGTWSLGMLDYIVYSTNASDATTSAPHNRTARARTVAIATIVPCILLATIAVVGILWLRRRHLRANAVMGARVTKFDLEHPMESDTASGTDKNYPTALVTEMPLRAAGNPTAATTLMPQRPSASGEGNLEEANVQPSQHLNLRGRKGGVPRATLPVATTSSPLSNLSAPSAPISQQPAQTYFRENTGAETDLPPPSYDAVFQNRVLRRSPGGST